MKSTQKIKRSDLQTIYTSVCGSWQKRIAQLALFQSGEEIEVENTLVIEAFKEANEKQKALIKDYFVIVSSKIQDRIKTWEDVVKEYESKYKEKVSFPTDGRNKQQRSINAFYQIQLISKVLNEDDNFPDFKNANQSKYYSYFERKPLLAGRFILASSTSFALWVSAVLIKLQN